MLSDVARVCFVASEQTGTERHQRELDYLVYTSTGDSRVSALSATQRAAASSAAARRGGGGKSEERRRRQQHAQQSTVVNLKLRLPAMAAAPGRRRRSSKRAARPSTPYSHTLHTIIDPSDAFLDRLLVSRGAATIDFIHTNELFS